MQLGQLSHPQLAEALGFGAALQIGPFAVRLRSDVQQLVAPLHLFYARQELLEASHQRVCDLYLQLTASKGIRRWWRPQVRLQGDAAPALHPFPQDHAFPYFEWGLNHSIASQAQNFLMLHAGVVARNGRVLLMPAPPTTGKSTLTAALTLRGWGCYTDEIALLNPRTHHFSPLPRPIALKNESIELIQSFAPQAEIGPHFPNTRKGTVAHLALPASSLAVTQQPAQAAWILFLRRQPGSRPLCRRLSEEEAFLGLAGNAFNYEIQGAQGFRAITHLIRTCHLFELTYDDLERGVQAVEAIVGDHPARCDCK